MLVHFLDLINHFIHSEFLTSLILVIVPFWVFYWCISTIKYLMWGK